MSKFSPSEIFEHLQLSRKFNGDHQELPFSLKDLKASVVKNLAKSLEKLHEEHIIGNGPLGHLLIKWADENVGTIVSAAPVAEEPAPVEEPEPVVEAPVVEPEPVVDPVVEEPAPIVEPEPVVEPVVEDPTPVEAVVEEEAPVDADATEKKDKK